VGGALFALLVFTSVCVVHSPAQAKEAQSYLDTAQGYLAKGNFKAAEIELRNAAREAPQDAHVHALLAQVYLNLGDFKSAEREARSARDLKGEEADYLLPLADAMLRQGKFADIAAQIKPGNRAPELESKVRVILSMAAAGLRDPAKTEALLREAIALDDKAVGPKIALARLLLGGKADEAEKIVDAIVAADPKAAEAIAVKGEILAKRGDVDGAIARFGDALAVDPNNRTAHLSRANLNLGRSDYAAVDKDIDPILANSPQDFGANYLRALEFFRKRDFAAADKIFDRLSPKFDDMVQGLYVQAATKYALGQYGQADDAIAKYVARVPQNPYGARLGANIALRQKAPDIAVKYLTAYLAKSPPDPATLSLLGNTYAVMNKPALAFEQYEKAAALAPENPGLKTMVAASELDAGQGAKGLDELEKVFATDTGVTIAGPTLVLTHLRAGEPDKAAEVAEKLVKANGESQLYQNLLGLARMAQQNYPAAEEIFKNLTAKNPDFAPATTNLAHVYVVSGRADDAKKVYQDFLARKPNEVSILLGLTDLARDAKQWEEAIGYANRARKAAPADPTPGLKLLNLYALQQDWPRAKPLASELTVQFPSNVDVFDAQGRVLVASGDRDGAINSYKRAYEIAPNSGPILSRYLSLLAGAKKFPEVRAVLQARLEKDPGNREVKVQLIRAEAEIGGLDAALSKAQSFAKDDPDSAVYDLVSADLYERAEKRPEAVALLEKAIAAHPSDDGLAIALSRLYSRAGDPARAEAGLRAGLKAHPDDILIRQALADFFINNKKIDLAIGEEMRLLADRANDPVALNDLAYLYQQDGNLTKAREFAEQAVAAAPTNGAIADTLGWVLVAQGDIEKALPRLQAAGAAMPGNPEIQYHLAVALGRAGRPGDARAVLEKLLSSGASFTSKEDAQKLLDELKRG